jgi:hypothetical protein
LFKCYSIHHLLLMWETTGKLLVNMFISSYGRPFCGGGECKHFARYIVLRNPYIRLHQTLLVWLQCTKRHDIKFIFGCSSNYLHLFKGLSARLFEAIFFYLPLFSVMGVREENSTMC